MRVVVVVVCCALAACLADPSLPDDVGSRTPCRASSDCPRDFVCPVVGDGLGATCLPTNRKACGNAVLDDGEACDDGNLLAADGCRPDCTAETCGDGVLDADETCDDGDESNDDACLASCAPNVCGDGFLLAGVEVCDDENTASGDGCRGDCGKVETCGDGVVDVGEACDGAPGCNPLLCALITCGDARVDTGEACDDGDDGAEDPADVCRANCTVRACGDQIVDVARGEVCDDGDTASGDGCSGACDKIETCGDGLTDVGEACDDGNTNDGDGCRGDCGKTEVCGDGARDFGEVCDDGNTGSGDGCRGDCAKIESCGDLVVDDGEACDDGNLLPNDGCEACRTTAWRARVVVGPGAAGPDALTTAFPSVGGLAVDRDGEVYVGADCRLSRLRADEGVVYAVAGTGVCGAVQLDGVPATESGVSDVDLVVADVDGDVFFETSNTIRRVDADGVVRTVAAITTVTGLALDGAGDVYVASVLSDYVERVDADGNRTAVAGNGTDTFSGEDVHPSQAGMNAVSLAFDAEQRLLIGGDDRIRRVTQVGTDDARITTIAGTGVAAAPVDGADALASPLASPRHVVVDRDGDVYFESADRIWRIDAEQKIRLVAGNGTNAVGPDLGVATAVPLREPGAIGVGPDGSVYFVEAGAFRVRRVRPDGMIETIAGTGVGAPFREGELGTGASFESTPRGLAVDGAGGVLFTDNERHQVRRLGPDGLVTLVAGVGEEGFAGDGESAVEARLRYPTDVAVDVDGRVLIADVVNNRVRRVELDGTIDTIAGDGSDVYDGDDGDALLAGLPSPSSVAADGAGRVYVASTSPGYVRVVETDGTIRAVLESSAPVRDLYVDSLDRLHLATDVGVLRIGPDGGIVPVIDNEDTGFGEPYGVAVDAAGDVYASYPTAASPVVRRAVVDGGVVEHLVHGGFGVPARGDGLPAADENDLSQIGRMLFDRAGRLVFEQGSGFGRIRLVEHDGTTRTIAGAIDPPGVGAGAAARLASARALVAIGPDAFVVPSTGTGRLWRVDVARGFVDVVLGRADGYDQGGFLGADPPAPLAALLQEPAGAAYDADARMLFVAERERRVLSVVVVADADDPSSWRARKWAGAEQATSTLEGALGDVRFFGPAGMAFDPGDRVLYVADRDGSCIRAVDVDEGQVTTYAGACGVRGFYGEGVDALDALFALPEALAIGADGSLYVADTGNDRVRRITPAGTTTTILGDGSESSSGDGAPASSYPVDGPAGLAVDARGDLFVSSSTTVRLLAADAAGVVDGSGPVLTIFGAPPREDPSARAARCLSGIAAPSDGRVFVVDACQGFLVDLVRAGAECGDGAPDVGESCDDGDLDDGDACTTTCTAPACGDGRVSAGEACDDGNATGGDGCSAACSVEGASGVVAEVHRAFPAPPSLGLLDRGAPAHVGVATTIAPAALGATPPFAARMHGLVAVPASGRWTFYVSSGAPARLAVDDVAVVDLDAADEGAAVLDLAAGAHPIELRAIVDDDAPATSVEWSGPGTPRAVVPASALRHVAPANEAVRATYAPGCRPATPGAGVVNGDFEAPVVDDVDALVGRGGDLGGWTVRSAVRVATTTWEPGSGLQSVRLSDGGAIARTVSSSPGAATTIQLCVSAGPSAAANAVDVVWGGVVVARVHAARTATATNMGWSTVNVRLPGGLTTGSTTELVLQAAAAGTNGPVVDAVSVCTGACGLAAPIPFLSEVADHATTTGASFVEIAARAGAHLDLRGWSLARYPNTGGPPVVVSLDAVATGDGVSTVAANGVSFAIAWGVGADGSGAVNGAGDDAVALVDPHGTIVDVYGVPGVDGTGQAWDYAGKSARRAADVTAGTTTWTATQWTIADVATATPGVR